ncbi:MAG: GTPase Era [Lutispora sp.]|jgi:GTP-binding protein Era|uniref:GTPase Era n=1 Tax=Lutispora sp. TaxID=2828727 RepID=UPI00356B167A
MHLLNLKLKLKEVVDLDANFKSGFVSIIGRPNVGKSTLINTLMGERLNIISEKPQTTRNTIRTILTHKDYQIVFLDTPGIHKPKHKLGEYMVSAAVQSLKGVDVVVVLIDCSTHIGSGDIYIFESVKNIKTRKILALNKIDKISKRELEGVLAKITLYEDIFDSIVPISAKMGNNTDDLITEIVKFLPEGPMYFPSDMITDVPEKFIVAEYIREKILLLTKEEIPHGTAVEVTSMKERDNKDLIDIEATIYCEKESHKRIIIGKQGSMLKAIGSRARVDIENLLNCKVNLQLWVKVKRDWRDNLSALKALGFN